MRFLARGTQLPAVVAQLAAAPLAAVGVILRHAGTAVVTGNPAPVVQLHVGAAPGVGVERLRYQQIEVVNAALGQCGSNCRAAIALAKRLALDVRVGHLRVTGSRIGIAGHDPVRARLTQPLPVQPDVERPQVDAL